MRKQLVSDIAGWSIVIGTVAFYAFLWKRG